MTNSVLGWNRGQNFLRGMLRDGFNYIDPNCEDEFIPRQVAFEGVPMEEPVWMRGDVDRIDNEIDVAAWKLRKITQMARRVLDLKARSEDAYHSYCRCRNAEVRERWKKNHPLRFDRCLLTTPVKRM